MDINDKVENINSRADFISFLGMLIKDLNNNKSEWENDTLESFLEGLYGYNYDTKIDDPTWKNFAEMLLVASIYE